MASAMVFADCLAAGLREFMFQHAHYRWFMLLVLAPRRLCPLLIGFPSCVYSLSSMTLSAIRISQEDYKVKPYQLYSLCASSYCLKVILIPLKHCWISFSVRFNARYTDRIWSLNPKTKFIDGWTKFNNVTLWPSCFAVFMSFCFVICIMIGFDTSFHFISVKSASIQA
ncbi:hypothetical protein SJAG_05254 [Schizosaccharomyces japonicus yFS275]|uniref:Uncharacterized protein n=1 Tax=Schizosaccharomyces japonicus (strain yFS275 / FY16936) TaxID=402676 RepID=B6JZR4_SCHJY|nr:hypothetical protein SJAG_05254 [Schizosaccharomyces japonicus yFS275]EEB07032.1 hypothetical protein SJAG_05254 [Schizosaccharomyces japonicus yFS275]